MAAKAPFWEIVKTDRVPMGWHKDDDGEKVTVYRNQPWHARLKARNGRIVVSTETYRDKKSVLKAINIVDPEGRFDISEEVLDLTS